ncbi:MAG TPA: hypothetical protein VNO33_18015 [Kofleriaceae bacterium]|nr:hypothetical protein [Kofleriaceae bacterium]
MTLTRPLAVSLIGLSALAACVDDGSAEVEDAVAELGSRCQATRLEPGVFSTDADEGRLVFSADGRHAYFHRTVDAGLRILESHRSHGVWSEPALVSFSSGHDEFDPFITLDGRTIYYTSFQPVPGAPTPRGDGDIWKVERTGSGWSAPIHVAEVNSEFNEFFPSTSLDGTLYFNSDRPGGPGAWDLYSARPRRGGFRAPQPLAGAVNTEIWEFNPSPSPGGTLLAFASLDPDPAAPYSDIFFALRLGGEYSPGVNAGRCVNTELEEYHPTLDLARARLVFVRRDPFNPVTEGDFYEVRLPDSFRLD